MTARTTLNELIDQLRGMTDAGTGDYTIGTAAYWDSDHMQIVLDRHRNDVYYEPLYSISKIVAGGSIEYYDYYSQYKNYEQTSGGSAIFFIQDGMGTVIGTASYTADYLNGHITFGTNTSGTAYYLTGRSYDLNAAAADIWGSKASYYATRAIDFSTDNHRFSQSQIIDHCLAMEKKYASFSGPGSTLLERSDLNVNPE